MKGDNVIMRVLKSIGNNIGYFILSIALAALVFIAVAA